MRYIFTTVVGTILCLALCSYVLAIRPHQRINQILANAPHEHVQPPALLQQLVEASQKQTNNRVSVSRRLVSENFPKQKQITRSIYELICMGYLQLSYTTEEIFTLWCHFYFSVSSEDKVVHGISQSAREIYGKNLRELTEEEMASLVVRLRSPRTYALDQERLEVRTREFLKQIDS